MNLEPQNNNQKTKVILAAVAVAVLCGGIFALLKARHSGTGGATVVEKTPAQIPQGQQPSEQASQEISKASGAAVSKNKTTLAMPSVPSTPGAALAPLPGALPVVEKADQCVTITYHHKPMASHPDEESCSHHKNLLKLTQVPDMRINPSSICVRVNGTPVPYLSVKGHADEVVFGAVAGPQSKVTVRYCTGKSADCPKEDCTVPKDEFMEAIGGQEGDSGKNAKLGQWDPSAPAGQEADVMAKLDGSVKKELETNDDLNGRAPAGELFKDWIGQTESAACGTTHAQN